MGEKIRAEDVLPLLRKVRRSGKGWTSCCPSHDDKRPSLSIANGDRGLMLHCFTGCPVESIKQALGIERSQYFPIRIPRKPPPPREPSRDFGSIFRKWEMDTDGYFLDGFSMVLGVEADALRSIGCAWADREWADEERRQEATPGWAFPMKNPNGTTVGLRIRGNEGGKWAMPGSRNGLFLPVVAADKTDVLWIVEGPTDTAAALTINLNVIGRPSCSACDDMVVQYLKHHRIRRAIIITDNDQPDKHGVIAGQRGAAKLQSVLPIKSCIWVPPCKDLREFVALGGDRDLIESSIRDLVWRAA